jgi:hypothetical protein
MSECQKCSKFPYFFAWVLFGNKGDEFGKTADKGIGEIYGCNFNQVEEIAKEIFENLGEWIVLEKNPNAFGIEFKVTDIQWEEGQQTFPETCAWDFPPTWIYDLTDIKYQEELPNE